MTIEVKRGASISFGCVAWQDKEANVRQDLTGYAIACDVVEKATDRVVDTMSVEVTNAAQGEHTLTPTTGSSSWPVGMLRYDIRYKSPEGVIVYTSTGTLSCVKQQTVRTV